MNLDTWNMSVSVPRVEVHSSVSEFLFKERALATIEGNAHAQKN
jgi:hypothetical protein